MSDSSNFNQPSVARVLKQGQLPQHPEGSRQWEELAVSQQDQILLAAVHCSEDMFALAEVFDLKHGTAINIFLRLHQLDQPAKDDRQRRILEGRALRQTRATNLGERLRRAISRRDGQTVAGIEPPITGEPHLAKQVLTIDQPQRLPQGSLRRMFRNLWQERGWSWYFVTGCVVVGAACFLWAAEFLRLCYWLLASIFGWPQIELFDGPAYRR
jgi:hypothetical protein